MYSKDFLTKWGLNELFLWNVMFNILFSLAKVKEKLKHYEKSYAGIISIDEEIAKKQKEIVNIDKNISDIKNKYNQDYDTYNLLKQKLAIFEENLEMAEVGVYTPHFDFGTSEIYKENINAIRQKQKDMIKKVKQ